MPKEKIDASLAALLAKEREFQAASTKAADDGKTEYYRRRKAKDFVQGYIKILAIKEEFLANGGNPEDFTAITAEELLYQEWTLNASNKASAAI
jgi:hypothetical protein